MLGLSPRDPSKTFLPPDKRRIWLLAALLFSLAVHFVLLLTFDQDTAENRAARQKAKAEVKVPIQLSLKKKPETKTVREEQRIIEAPMVPTEPPPPDKSFLGAQDHKAVHEQKVSPKASLPGAPSTALQNGPLKIEDAPPDKGGTIPVPAKNKDKQSYAKLLPQGTEILNLGHNDYIPDKNLPTGAVMDVNTTDYRFIGYFTSVRKLVELAMTDVGPTLRKSPYIRGRLSEVGKVAFQGESKVRLKVVRSGLLLDTKLIVSSGDKEIDAFWQKILNVAAPFPPLPLAYPEEELVFTYTLYYDIVLRDSERVPRFTY